MTSSLPALLPIGLVKLNDDNPRQIKDARFAQLVQSLRDFPEMLALRPLVVDEDHVVLGGNMRLRAMQKLGFTECHVVVASGLTTAQKREFIIKDNGSFGEHDWDALSSGDWPDAATLNDWGVNVPAEWGEIEAPNLKDLSNSIEVSLRIEVECETEQQQEGLYNKLIAEGFKCRLLTL